MKLEDNYLQAILVQNLKPIVKVVLQELISENLLVSPNTPTAHDNMINTAEACRFLGRVDRHTLYKYIAEGLPAYKNGKSYKFRIIDLNEFLNKKKKAK